MAAVNDVQSILGYQFGNLELLLEALKATGSGLNLLQSRSVMDGNRRLAQVGAAAIKMAVLNNWYHSGNDRGVTVCETLNKYANGIASGWKPTCHEN